MRPRDLRALLTSAFGAKEQEIVCSTFFDQLPRYVDLALRGEVSPGAPPPESLLPDVAQHIQQCGECAEAYELLREVATLER